jgi:hypothetical protein
LQWTPERLIGWGQSIGVATGRTVERLLLERRHPEHGYRACLGLLAAQIESTGFAPNSFSSTAYFFGTTRAPR